MRLSLVVPLFLFYLPTTFSSHGCEHWSNTAFDGFDESTSDYSLLPSGEQFPRAFFGTAALPRGHAQVRILSEAIEAGFRSFDTAMAREWYDEAAVGDAIVESNIPREDFYVLTKLHPRDLGYDATRQAITAGSALRDRVTYLDAVLLHYPRCFEPVCTRAEVQRTEKAGGWKQSWRALIDLRREGKIRAIGLSNFDLATLKTVHPLPDIVQNWMDPFHQDREVWEWCRENGVAYMAYSALGGQWEHQQTQDSQRRPNPIHESTVIGEIAKGKGISREEVVLRWALQRRAVVIPRSSNPEHIRRNAMFVNLASPEYQSKTLSHHELGRLDQLDSLVDDHSQCQAWAELGECHANPAYMTSSCRNACIDHITSKAEVQCRHADQQEL